MQPGKATGFRVLRVVVPIGLGCLGLGLWSELRSLETYVRSPFPLSPTPKYSSRATLPDESTPLIARAQVPVEYVLQRGETAIQVLTRLGLPGQEARAAASVLAERVDLRGLKAGNRYSAFFNPDSSLAAVKLTLAGSGQLEMTRGSVGQWETAWQPFHRSTELRAVHGSLDGPLDASIRRAGGPSGLAYRMADVLRWDLDFGRDLKRGDRFEVLYEEVQLDGHYHAIGDVIGLRYESQGRVHEAYRFGESGVYYDGAGRPLKKMFLASPLRYSRITSSFTKSRFHPVLKCFLPHHGIDYAAPIGTPVEATASGVVIAAGWDGGGGNAVKVQHAGGYVTGYLHLSRFAPGIRPGARVRQGEVIAWSGMTGLATGPHLDYRVKFHDQWIDPLSLHGVRDEPIPAAQLASFRSWRDGLRTDMARGGVVVARLPLAASGRPAGLQVAAAGLAAGKAPAGAYPASGAGKRIAPNRRSIADTVTAR